MIAKRVTRTSGDRFGRLARYLAAPGDPGGTRTPYLQIRNLSLYPDELRDHTFYMPHFTIKHHPCRLWGGALLPADHRKWPPH